MQELNILGFSHCSITGYLKMKEVCNHIPRNGDIVGIKNARGDYLGRSLGVVRQPLQLASNLLENEYFVFETKEDDKFVLKQKVTGMYIGITEHVPDRVAYAGWAQDNELLSYSILPSGMLTINNKHGHHMSNQNGKVCWSFASSLNEAWKFELVVASAQGCSSIDRCLSLLSLPPEGTVLTISHPEGGYIGGARSDSQCLQVVPNAGDFEKWVLEKREGYCGLRQKVTGLYFGRSDQFGAAVGLAAKWQRNQKLTIEETPGGYAIRNENGYYATKDMEKIVWTRELTFQETWRIQVAPTIRLNISAIASKTSTGSILELYPTQGGLYAIVHAGGGYIGGTRENHQELELVKEPGEEGLWIFEKKGNVFALKQRLTGLWLGHNGEPGDHIALAPAWHNCETFMLHKHSDGVYAIKNHKNLFLSKMGNKLLWVNTYGPEELWSFETTASSLVDLRDMNGQMFGICHSEGGYIGGVKSGNLITVPRLDKWEFWVLEVHGDRYALRQQVSSKYLGIETGVGVRVGLTPRCLANELFTLQHVENDLFTIRNHCNNYLTKKNQLVVWTNTCTKQQHWRFEHIDQHGGLVTESKIPVFLSEAVFGKRLPPLMGQIKNIMTSRTFQSEFLKR